MSELLHPQKLPLVPCVSGALLPVLHQLFKVHETSGYGRSSSGKKPPPHALRCNLIVPPEEQQPSPGQLRGQQHENQQAFVLIISPLMAKPLTCQQYWNEKQRIIQPVLCNIKHIC
eukprot:1138300-Pelagomonas_calceolata.AAC.9